MTDAEFIADMRSQLSALTREMRDPFASLILFDGKYIPRSQARAIERSLWPLAFPKIGREVLAA